MNNPIRRDVKKIDFSWPKLFLSTILLSTVVGAFFSVKIFFQLEENIAKAKEEARPANIKLTKITVPNCPDCFAVDTAVANLKKQNVKIVEEKLVSFPSAEADSLMQRFGISKLPTYVLEGEVEKKNLELFAKNNGEVKNDAFIFTKVLPVFVDPKTKKEMGKVSVTYITDTLCTQCANPKLIVTSYAQRAGIKIADEKELDWQTAEAQALITAYRITKIPTFLFSKDIEVYENVKNAWIQLGSVAQDGTYIASTISLPYRDLEKGSIQGLVDVIYVIDKACSECYKPETTQRTILTQGYRMGIRSERTVDVSSYEGQNLITRYAITKVPTVLLSPEANEYSALKNVWKNVGTIETDGWYIFRQMNMLAKITYKDLESNSVIRPTPQPTAQQGG